MYDRHRRVCYVALVWLTVRVCCDGSREYSSTGCPQQIPPCGIELLQAARPHLLQMYFGVPQGGIGRA